MDPDFEDKCLICLKTGINLNIFTTYNISKDKEELYVEVIKNCFGIEIAPDSGLNVICNDCSIKLRKAYAFKSDILEAINRLVVVQDNSTEENEYSPIKNLNIQFENDYDIKTVLNPVTGQITYTLDKIDEIKETTHHEPETYLIDLENDVVMTKNEAEKNTVRKYKRKNVDVVKENLPVNENKNVKVKRVKKDGKKKDVDIVSQYLLPNTEETKKVKKPPKSRTKKIITLDGLIVHSTEEEVLNKKTKKQKETKAKEPLFTLEPDQTKCTLCSAEFETNKALNTHMNAHFPEHSCADCGMAFASQSRLRMHSYQAHVEGPHNCKYCDKVFANVNTRNAHMWRVHTKQDPFKCAECGERFKTYLKRLRHAQAAHARVAEYPCQYCDKKFAYAAYRTKHVRTIHLEARPHKCPSCPFSFARRRELDAHRASKHGDGELKYQCDECSKRFFFKSALKWHVNLHNRYNCTQCEAKFTHAAQLEAHQKTHEPTHDIHTDIPSLDILQFEELSDLALESPFWVLNEI